MPMSRCETVDEVASVVPVGVAVVPVHAQPALVVGAPEAEGDEPGVQQAGVVGVLDVLLHELPVTRNALAVVAQDLELAAVEQAIEPPQDLRAQVVLEGLHVEVEGGEDHAAARGHLQLGQAVVGGLEVRRHAALDLAVLLDAPPQRYPAQLALQVVAPLVIRADEGTEVAVPFAAETHAAVGAHVLEDVERAVGVAHQDHRALAHHRSLEVPGVGHLGLQAHVAPVAPVEEALQLLAIDLIAGVGDEGDAVRAVAFPDGLAGEQGEFGA